MPGFLRETCVAAVCWISGVAAQENGARSFQLGGVLFGDLYHVVSHHTDEGDGATVEATEENRRCRRFVGYLLQANGTVLELEAERLQFR